MANKRLAILKVTLLIVIIANLIAITVAATLRNDFGHICTKISQLNSQFIDQIADDCRKTNDLELAKFNCFIVPALIVYLIALYGTQMENLLIVSMFAIIITAYATVNLLDVDRTPSTYIGSVFVTVKVSSLAIALAVLLWYENNYKKQFQDKGVNTDQTMGSVITIDAKIDQGHKSDLKLIV